MASKWGRASLLGKEVVTVLALLWGRASHRGMPVLVLVCASPGSKYEFPSLCDTRKFEKRDEEVDLVVVSVHPCEGELYC